MVYLNVIPKIKKPFAFFDFLFVSEKARLKYCKYVEKYVDLIIERNRPCRVAQRELTLTSAPIYHHDYTYTTTIQRARFKISAQVGPPDKVW